MSHYFDRKQHSPVDEKEITVRVAGLTLTFYTANGLFSKDHLDTATKLLLENANLQGVDTVLDLGSGWGVVGVVLKKLFPELEVTCTDVSERAVFYTEKNAKRHKTEVITHRGFAYEDLATFDCILTNPPYSAGRDVCFQFIEEAKDHLNPGGCLQVVARHQKGGKMLQQKMEEVFGNCEVLAKGSGFRVYSSRL